MVLKTPNANFPALHKRLVVDTVNGKVRVRKWPEKRGKNVPLQVRIQNERFAAAQRLAKTAKASIMNRFIDATKGTGLYPRDLFTKMMLAPPIELETPDGRIIRYGRATLETEVFQGCILKLDANYNTSGGGAELISWGLPTLDTSNFFDIAQPDRITIPPGVKVVNIFTGLRRSAATSEFVAGLISHLPFGGNPIATNGGFGVFNPCTATGPIIVNENDQIGLLVNTALGSTWLKAGTYFGLQILAAEV